MWCVSGADLTGSIISKKAAEGLSTLVLDVKTGNGAFMAKMEDAEKLAQLMVSRNPCVNNGNSRVNNNSRVKVTHA